MSTDGGGWTAIQKRQDGSTDFYRTWSEYKQGFGDPSKNYWIGNDPIHELTKNKDQELRVELQSFDGAEAYAQYSTFYVGDEDSKFKLTVSGYSGTAGDSLTYNNGYEFTTKDQDNDIWSRNCATEWHGAWWYSSCAFANLNGQYAQSAVSAWKYPVWYQWKEKEALKQTVLMIRHKNCRASNVLRDILNQESLVRFSMVQKIQNLVMDAIDNKNNRQVMKAKLSEVTKELQDLETRNQVIEEENSKLKEELKVVYGTMNAYRNYTMEEIQNLNQTEILFLKSKTVALHDENLKLALKNSAFEKQLDLLNKTIKQTERGVRKDMETLKSSDIGTLDRINTLNKSHVIEVKKNFQKIKELDDGFRNKSLVLENTDRGLSQGMEVLQDQMNEMNPTLQISGVEVLARQIKKMEDKFKSFAASVNETFNNVQEDLNESNWSLSKVLSINSHSCLDILRKYPFLKGGDGVHIITVNSKVKSVYCDMSTDGGGWTAIQRRQDGSTDFYRTWSEYKQGFGDAYKNYWIGNDAINELTRNRDQELRVELQSFGGAEAYAHYSTFYVGDEGSKYKLTVSGYSGTAADSLTYHSGRRFSTKDQDNDDHSSHCAVSDHGGWWYKSCHYSNLNGQYTESVKYGSKYPVWYDWRGSEALKKTLMMIRKKNRNK
ncbi:fibroleukin-like, partial [Saccostrea cucullata]|uniref:fibroleukin-like n=1 Tax=Saccostrea cuccullata TaxID=36930 RepID=UPI002ED1AC0F